MILSLVGVALPTFLIGIVLILIFSVWLGWLPSFGRGTTIAFGSWTTGLLTASGLKALVLPSLTLGLFQMTLILRLIRAEMLEVLRADYIKFARARGLKSRAVNYRHALKNTLVPVITIMRAAIRQHLCVLDRRRDGVPMARSGASRHPVDPVRRRCRCSLPIWR